MVTKSHANHAEPNGLAKRRQVFNLLIIVKIDSTCRFGEKE